MFETRFVARRIRRIAIAIGTSVSAAGIGAFSIIAFMGRYVGTFTVSLDMANVSMALSESSSFQQPESFLHVDSLPKYSETTYRDLPADIELDSEETDYLHGANLNPDGEIQNISYFKYTFFLKNVGTVAARYDLKVNILENEPSTDKNPRYLDETLRVKLYDNDATLDEHDATVYAKRRSIPYSDRNTGEVIWNTPISVTEKEASSTNPFQGYAEMFETDTCICTITTDTFLRNEVKRYTLVTWLEGYDESSDWTLPAPEGAKLKLGVEIKAYEN